MRSRLAATALFSVLFVLSGTAVAGADPLVDHMRRQETATYAGQVAVVCSTPDGPVSQVLEIAQTSGVVVTSGTGADGLTQTRVADPDSWTLGARYSVAELGADRFLNRAVEVFEVHEAGAVRMRLLFDAETGVTLSTDTFNADGTTYCSVRFVDFRPGASGISAGHTDLPAPARAVADPAAASSVLPPQVAGFERTAVAEGPESSIRSGFYRDGLFTFSLLNSPKVIAVPELADTPAVEVNGSEYQRRYGPGTVVYAWFSDAGGYVLMGDLPVDLQEAVLADLPEPTPQGFFSRLWRNLFGG